MNNRLRPITPDQIAEMEFNCLVQDLIVVELERWKLDPLIPTLGIAGDICEALRSAGLLRGHSH
jgi:hypothetical protein